MSGSKDKAANFNIKVIYRQVIMKKKRPGLWFIIPRLMGVSSQTCHEKATASKML